MNIERAEGAGDTRSSEYRGGWGIDGGPSRWYTQLEAEMEREFADVPDLMTTELMDAVRITDQNENHRRSKTVGKGALKSV